MLAITIDNLPGYEIKKVIGEVVGTTARARTVNLNMQRGSRPVA
jgi:uncharacterized protein YbjQ (UPF0145 family)